MDIFYTFFGLVVGFFFLHLKIKINDIDSKVDDINSKLDYLMQNKHFQDSLRENHKLGELLAGDDSKDYSKDM